MSPLWYQPSISFWFLIYLFKLCGFMYLFIAKKCLFILPVCMCSVFNEKGLIKLMPEIHVCIFRGVCHQGIWLSSPVLSEAVTDLSLHLSIHTQRLWNVPPADCDWAKHSGHGCKEKHFILILRANHPHTHNKPW